MTMTPHKKQIPVLVTIDGSSLHELTLIDPNTQKYEDLVAWVVQISNSSPNTEEFMSKYKAKTDKEPQCNEIKVRWGQSGRDMKYWPATTVITNENFGAVLAMVRVGNGKDIFEASFK
jgi:hypothetical protein